MKVLKKAISNVHEIHIYQIDYNYHLGILEKERIKNA